MAQISRYPAKVMNITQSYKGSFSHSKNYNGSPRDYPIDEACADAGRSYFYAPFDCVVKRIYGVGSKGVNTIWIQSTAPVQTPVFTDHVTVIRSEGCGSDSCFARGRLCFWKERMAGLQAIIFTSAAAEGGFAVTAGGKILWGNS